MIAHPGLWLTLLGFAAGAINAFSTVPQLIAAYREHRKMSDEDAKIVRSRYLRNLAQLIGNALWVAYGIGTHSLAIIVFCTINATLVLALIVKERAAVRPG